MCLLLRWKWFIVTLCFLIEVPLWFYVALVILHALLAFRFRTVLGSQWRILQTVQVSIRKIILHLCLLEFSIILLSCFCPQYFRLNCYWLLLILIFHRNVANNWLRSWFVDRAVLCSSLIDVEDYGNFVEQQNKWEIRAILGESGNPCNAGWVFSSVFH